MDACGRLGVASYGLRGDAEVVVVVVVVVVVLGLLVRLRRHVLLRGVVSGRWCLRVGRRRGV